MKSSIQIGKRISELDALSLKGYLKYTQKHLTRGKENVRGWVCRLKSALQFADDQIICASDKEDLKYMVR